MTLLGTADLPLRVAVVGSGPSGFYAVEHLFKQTELVILVDMFDRLPTPFGLVRGGVAPDHDKIKSVTKVYERIASNPRFRFFGNVEFGKHISREEMKAYYHAIIYAVGAQTDRRLGIPGEDLPGSHAATEFVAWYNGHPDFAHLRFDLSQERVAVIGNGNVAMDVARILASSYDELKCTDIADYALEALHNSKVRDIYMLGRRGPAQAAFTHPELKEFGELASAAVVVDPLEAQIDPLSAADLEAHPSATAKKNLDLLQKYVQMPPTVEKPRRIHMRFLLSPTELIGTDHVEAIRLVKNELQLGSDGSLRAKATQQTETLPVGLVFRSIGYMGVPLPDVLFDSKGGVIPNKMGRVTDPTSSLPVEGEYVVGWIKRGPSGVIGTNKPDSVETVESLLTDVTTLTSFAAPDIEPLIRDRQPDYVSFEDWRVLDQLETAKGAAQGRPRVKFSDVNEMIEAIKDARGAKTTEE